MLILINIWLHIIIKKAWEKRTLFGLWGIRKVGKTSLCKGLSNIEYSDCESSRVQQLFVDFEGFLASKRSSRIVLNEIHHLDNPSEVLN